ncbi:MAG: hypothetical protein ACRCXZ_08335 [Patescibacteria group bacterium]
MFKSIRLVTENVELIEFNNKLYILKTFDNFKAIDDVKCFIDTLSTNEVKTIKYYDFEFLADNQLCFDYINKVKTFDVHKSKDLFQKVGLYLSKIHKAAHISHGNLKLSNVLISEDDVYFINPKINNEPNNDVAHLLFQSLPFSKEFVKSINQQDFNQNENLESFYIGYNQEI